jgi:hypothetical protein
LDKELPDRGVILSSAILLIERVVDASRLRERLGRETLPIDELRALKTRLHVEESLLEVRSRQAELSEQLNATPPAQPLRVFRRTLDVVTGLLALIDHRAALAIELGDPKDEPSVTRSETAKLRPQSVQLRREMDFAISEAELQRIPELADKAKHLLRPQPRAAIGSSG